MWEIVKPNQTWFEVTVLRTLEKYVVEMSILLPLVLFQN